MELLLVEQLVLFLLGLFPPEIDLKHFSEMIKVPSWKDIPGGVGRFCRIRGLSILAGLII